MTAVMTSVEDEPFYEAHHLPRTLDNEADAKPCRYCRKPILWGITTSGKRAPFDLAPPHPNHHITCANKPKRKARPR